MEDLETWLERVYDSDGDHAKLNRLYNEWADDYDQQLWASGNPYIAIATGFAGRHIQNFDAAILDAGCGTGNMAQILNQMGYRSIDGLDPSEGMLKIARNKNIYQSLHRLYLDAEINLLDASYDAIVAAGVLTHGHAPPESLDGMLKIVKTDGVIIFSLSEIAYNDYGFASKMAELENNHSWALLDRSNLFRTYPFSNREAHLRHWVYAYRKTVN
ncbi:MAG: class I SAM-dependent methyltransferase [Gammaproteobacteria bacterium]|nr:class I SAM-dependent methyltransferase [Gammaproteobacteria bacterium]